MIGKLNHVAIAVPDLQKAAQTYRETLGARVSAAQSQPDHGGTVMAASGGGITFSDASKAGHGTFVNKGGSASAASPIR